MPGVSGKRTIKNHFVAALGEFAGTFLFLFISFAGTQTANEQSNITAGAAGPQLPQLTYISLVFGFSLAVNVWLFFRISGGLFNPVVTVALYLIGANGLVRSIFIFISQIVGGIAAAAVTRALLPGNDVIFAVTLSAGITTTQGLFLEMFLTAELVFAILMLAAEKTKATFVAPVGIGLALFVAELVGVYWTGGALNPARAFGPAVVAGKFNGYHWIYWLGPLLGSLLAVAFYKLVKFLNYEEVNGDQDKTPEEEERYGSDQREDGKVEKNVGKGGNSDNQRSENSRSDHSRSGRSPNNRHDQEDRGFYQEQRHSHQGQNNHPDRRSQATTLGDFQQNQNYNNHYQAEPVQQMQPLNYNGHPNQQVQNSNRNSRAFVPEPPSLEERQEQLNAPPSVPLDPNGQPYIQDVNAQGRGPRKTSLREQRYARDEDMEMTDVNAKRRSRAEAEADPQRHGSRRHRN